MRTSNTNSDSGYSGAFSWWRQTSHHALGYTVCNHTTFFEGTGVFDAVTDDFGNLVKAGK
jgi:hypothetical protein